MKLPERLGRACASLRGTLGGNDTKIAPPGDIFARPPGEMRRIQGKLVNYVGDHVFLSHEGAALVTSPGTESSYPPHPQSLNSRG